MRPKSRNSPIEMQSPAVSAKGGAHMRESFIMMSRLKLATTSLYLHIQRYKMTTYRT